MSTLRTYEDIKEWKESEIHQHLSDMKSLNSFHDIVMLKVLDIAIERLDLGKPPCHFCWFIAGSGGRYEQGIVSDQDHGIVFESFSEENEHYFLQLGKEISDGMAIVGYPYCNGMIMSSNPLWCKSLEQWKEQLHMWMEDGSWKSIRNLQIFFDSRCLYGEEEYVRYLKMYIFDYQSKNPYLLQRLIENIKHIKKAINPLGQLIVMNKGEHYGSIDLKYSAFIPYVNAIRVLSIKEGLLKTSTEERMKELAKIDHLTPLMNKSIINFQVLLNYRLSLVKVIDYDDTHFLNVNQLNLAQKKQLKRILKDGQSIHQYVLNMIKKGDDYGV